MKRTLKTVAAALACVALLSAGGVAVYKTNYQTNEIVAVATISQGSRGDTVRLIQQKLKRWGYYNGPVDGIFGTKTTAAVKYFQRKNGLTADGIVGKKTLAALGISSASAGTSQSSGSNYSDSDVNLLARLVYGEARGESYTGQIAVASVVLNRVKSSSFPNTIAGVI